MAFKCCFSWLIEIPDTDREAMEGGIDEYKRLQEGRTLSRWDQRPLLLLWSQQLEVQVSGGWNSGADGRNKSFSCQDISEASPRLLWGRVDSSRRGSKQICTILPWHYFMKLTSLFFFFDSLTFGSAITTTAVTSDLWHGLKPPHVIWVIWTPASPNLFPA